MLKEIFHNLCYKWKLHERKKFSFSKNSLENALEYIVYLINDYILNFIINLFYDCSFLHNIMSKY